MRRIEFYAPDGLKTMNFHFIDPIVEYQDRFDWAVIKAAGRSITIDGTAFLGYDDQIAHCPIFTDFPTFWKDKVNTSYKDGEKILLVFLENELPVMMFSGTAISLVKKNQHFAEFVIDGNAVWLHHMHFLILTKGAME